jgi:hypothetical protein
MGSGEVNKYIKKLIWPTLRSSGFDRFTSRTAWRHGADEICVVNFQSFHSYLAASLGSTSFSFAVNLGVFYRCARESKWAARYLKPCRALSLYPHEAQCHARLHLHKQLAQEELVRRHIWYVRPDYGNLAEVVHDALKVIEGEGLPWLHRYSNLEYALSLFHLKENADRPLSIPGYGSIAAAETGSAIAIHVRDYAAARKIWQQVFESPFYAQRNPEAIKRAKAMITAVDEEENLTRVRK